jgi:hypothetical protein
MADVAQQRALARLAQARTSRNWAAVVNVLRGSAAHADVQLAALSALAAAAPGTEARTAVQSGALAATVEAMRARQADAQLQLQGARALKALAPAAAAKALQAGALDVLLAALRSHGADGRVQHACCRALALFLAADEAVRVKALASGVVGAILTVLQRANSDPAVTWACEALLLLMTTPAGKQAALAGGALDACAVALEAQRVHTESVTYCCRVVSRLDDRGSACPALATALVAAMLLHLTNADVIFCLCDTLYVVCVEQETNRAATAAAGVMNVLPSALHAFPGDRNVWHSGCSLLRTLTYRDGDAAARAAAIRARAVPLLARELSKRARDTAAQMQAQDGVARSDAADNHRLTMRTRPRHASVATQLMGALAALLCVDEDAAAVDAAVQAGAIAGAAAMLSLHAEDAVIQVTGLKCLLCVLVPSLSARIAMMHGCAGAVQQAVHSARRMHHADADIVQSATMAAVAMGLMHGAPAADDASAAACRSQPVADAELLGAARVGAYLWLARISSDWATIVRIMQLHAADAALQLDAIAALHCA